MNTENDNSKYCENQSEITESSMEPAKNILDEHPKFPEIMPREKQNDKEVFAIKSKKAYINSQNKQPAFVSAKSALSGESIQTGVFYYLRSAMSRKCIDIDHANTADRTNCLLWTFNGAANQIWKLIKTDENYYQFIPWIAPNMRLTVLDGGDIQGGKVGIMTVSSTLTSQDWELTRSSRGNYVFRSRCSNGNKVLCINGSNGGTNDGAQIFQYTYSDDAKWLNDEWQLEPYYYPNNRVDSDTNYCLKCAMSDKYLDAENGGTADGTNCIQYHFKGENNQIWYVTQSTVSGYYQLAPRHAKNMRLTVLDGDNTEGANVGLKTATAGLASQDWKIEKSARGNFVIRSRCSGNSKVLCVNGNQILDDGGNVIQYTYGSNTTGWLNDEWIFEPLVAPYMEFDQGFFMHHSGYSSAGLTNALSDISDKFTAILSREFGIKFNTVVCKMISSIADDCGSIFYNCEHGNVSACTNTFLSDADGIHHKNWNKLLAWYKKRGVYPNSLQVFWTGHPKCIQNIDSSGNAQHSYFDLGEELFSMSYYGDRFIIINRPLTNTNLLIADLLYALSGCYDCHVTAHSAPCINDPTVNRAVIYDAVMGTHPTQTSFWCPECRAAIFNNISKLSKIRP